jgi:lipopolysaccharide/colanic/teichoic acid biosynthesis glycosyltransferase
LARVPAYGIILSKQDGENPFPANRDIPVEAYPGGLSQGIHRDRSEGMTRLLRPSLPPSLIVLATCDFLLLSGCFTLTAYWTQPSGLDLYLYNEGGLLQIALAVLVIQITLYFERMYEPYVALSVVVRQMWLALGMAFLVQAMLAYTQSGAQVPRWTMISGSLIALISFPLWRLAAGIMLGKSVPARKILFLGATSAAEEIALSLQGHPEVGLAAIGYVGPQMNTSKLPCLGSAQTFDAVIEEHAPHRIVIGRSTKGIRISRLLDLQKSGTRVEKLSRLYETVTGRISLMELQPTTVVFSAELDPRPGYLIARNIYSVLIGIGLLVAASPVLATAAIVAKCSSKDPVFGREPYVGLNGAPIALYRFRSAEIAKRLDKLYLARLPLLLNLVRGDLALVGPAPERPEFLAALRERIPVYSHRLSVKPGLTGWAQIHRDSGAAMPDTMAALEYDLYYIKHLSPRLDAYIMILSLRPR